MVARIAANMTRDSSPLAALEPSPGTSVYWFGSIPLFVCLEILASPSSVCKAHAILTAVPGYIKNSVKKISLVSNFHVSFNPIKQEQVRKGSFIWKKRFPGRRVICLPELPWVSQRFLNFL